MHGRKALFVGGLFKVEFITLFYSYRARWLVEGARGRCNSTIPDEWIACVKSLLLAHYSASASVQLRNEGAVWVTHQIACCQGRFSAAGPLPATRKKHTTLAQICLPQGS